MPDRVDTGEGALPPPFNAVIRRGEGYGWDRGCGVTLTDSTTDIEFRVGPGRVQSAGTWYDISETAGTLPPGDPTNYRKDIIGIDYKGDIRAIQGEPAARDPSDRQREFTKSPAPPSTASFDGVLLAEVWVPPEASSSADLGPQDIADRRISNNGVAGNVPTVAQRPAKADLTVTRWWFNENAGQFEAYIEAADEIVAFSTTNVTSFSGDTEVIAEDFENSIKGNWRGGDSEFTYDTPAFEGSAAAYWDDSGNTTDYSLNGDGLDYYAEPGDTITMAVRFNGGRYVDLGFGKEDDDFDSAYRLRLDHSNDELRVLATDSDGGSTTLGQASVTVNDTTWYWLEVDYDGGGRGVHPSRLYSTDTGTSPGSRDSQLAEIASPTQDESHEGRGYLLQAAGRARVDYLRVVR